MTAIVSLVWDDSESDVPEGLHGPSNVEATLFADFLANTSPDLSGAEGRAARKRMEELGLLVLVDAWTPEGAWIELEEDDDPEDFSDTPFHSKEDWVRAVDWASPEALDSAAKTALDYLNSKNPAFEPILAVYRGRRDFDIEQIRGFLRGDLEIITEMAAWAKSHGLKKIALEVCD